MDAKETSMIALLAAALIQGLPYNQSTSSWSVTVSGVTGLYDSSGSLTTSAVSLLGVTYIPVYGS